MQLLGILSLLAQTAVLGMLLSRVPGTQSLEPEESWGS